MVTDWTGWSSSGFRFTNPDLLPSTLTVTDRIARHGYAAYVLPTVFDDDEQVAIRSNKHGNRRLASEWIHDRSVTAKLNIYAW